MFRTMVNHAFLIQNRLSIAGVLRDTSLIPLPEFSQSEQVNPNINPTTPDSTNMSSISLITTPDGAVHASS